MLCYSRNQFFEWDIKGAISHTQSSEIYLKNVKKYGNFCLLQWCLSSNFSLTLTKSTTFWTNAKETSKYSPALLKITPLAGFPKNINKSFLPRMARMEMGCNLIVENRANNSSYSSLFWENCQQ